jgi:hypothetical protein
MSRGGREQPCDYCFHYGFDCPHETSPPETSGTVPDHATPEQKTERTARAKKIVKGMKIRFKKDWEYRR